MSGGSLFFKLNHRHLLCYLRSSLDTSCSSAAIGLLSKEMKPQEQEATQTLRDIDRRSYSFLSAGQSLSVSVCKLLGDLAAVIMLSREELERQLKDELRDRQPPTVTAWLTFPWCRQLLLFQEVAGHCLSVAGHRPSGLS